MSVLAVFSFGKMLSAKVPEDKKQPVKIGLLISDSNFQEAKCAAEMAVLEANQNIDFKDYSFQLITKSMEGPWGTGSKQTVDLVFNEEVWAILGSHDGRNAHLVEQVTAKTQIPFVSAWAGDPTLSQAYVPWYFSCVLNNNQQASLLVNEIHNHKKLTGIVTISDDEYDSKTALKSFLDNVKKEELAEPIQLFYKNENPDYHLLENQIKNANCDAVVLFGRPATSLKIIEMLRQKKMEQIVFGALTILDENPLTHFEWVDYEGVTLINPGYWQKDGIAFREKFKNKYGYSPGPVAAYSYDGINIIIEAIKKSNFDSTTLKQTFPSLEYNGITGSVRFDENGNRLNSGGLIVVANGIPETIEY